MVCALPGELLGCTRSSPLTSENISSNVKYLFWILSAASRKAITRRWLKPGKPTVEEWIDIIYDIFLRWKGLLLL